jgi:hypothetical protein
MTRLVNDILDSLALYGLIAFFSFWSMIAFVWFDFAEWLVVYLFYAMGALPLFVAFDVMLWGWRIWRGKDDVT